jgi:hypothetical protein
MVLEYEVEYVHVYHASTKNGSCKYTILELGHCTFGVVFPVLGLWVAVTLQQHDVNHAKFLPRALSLPAELP